MDFCLACLSVSQIAQNDTHITYRIDNRYDIPFLLSYGKSKVLLSPNRSLDIKLEKTVDKLKLDLTYIRKYSIWLDLQLILMTIKVLFMRESTDGFEDGKWEDPALKG